MAKIEVLNIANTHARLMVNGYGVATWHVEGDSCSGGDGLAYAEEAARVLRKALASVEIGEVLREPAVPPFVPGVYRHYKGGLYDAVCLARLSEHRSEHVVVYRSHETRETWVRPYVRPMLEGDDCWCDLVTWPDGERRARFVAVEKTE